MNLREIIYDVENMPTHRLNQTFRLNQSDIVQDLPLFLSSHINFLLSNPGNLAYNSYWNRLKFIHQKLMNDVNK